MTTAPEDRFGAEIAEVARKLAAETTAQGTLQTMVELAASTIEGCDHAGVTIIDGAVQTPAASDEVPPLVDRIQYEVDEGPCLDAIREQGVFYTADLRAEERWPAFSARAASETGVRSMLSFRLFLEENTLGALNLYSKRHGAFGKASRRAGEVFAAHAAVALTAAREHERLAGLQDDLQDSRERVQRYAQQVEVAVALQRSMLTELPDLGPLELAARYVPAVEAAVIGGDWYDAFWLPRGATALVIGDIAGHDLDAAVAMGQARSALRTLAVDRQEAPSALLSRLDGVLGHLLTGQTATCVYAELEEDDGAWSALLANAGHPPPLHITRHGAAYVDALPETLLGVAIDSPRSDTRVALPPGSTLVLYTDGLIERRGRSIDVGLTELQAAAQALADSPVDELCDELLARFAAQPADDVCLLALRVPLTGR